MINKVKSERIRLCPSQVEFELLFTISITYWYGEETVTPRISSYANFFPPPKDNINLKLKFYKARQIRELQVSLRLSFFLELTIIARCYGSR